MYKSCINITQNKKLYIDVSKAILEHKAKHLHATFKSEQRSS